MARRVTRRAQTIVPFGVGSIVEFEDEALMMAGLDEWPRRECVVLNDDRLAHRLNVEHFLLPPPKPERGAPAGTAAPLPYVRFPRWHFCPRCRFLRKAKLFDERRPRCDNPSESPRRRGQPTCGSRQPRSRPFMLPLRFVAVCRAGHIEDFPWNAWAHLERGEELARNEGCKPEQLYFYATMRGGLSGLIVECGACGSKRSMMGVTSPTGLKGFVCSGQRPWLGDDAAEPCKAESRGEGGAWMLALQRGSSNLYFPDVASSILIPPFSSRIQQILANKTIMEAIESGTENGKIPDTVFISMASRDKVDPEELKAAYYQRKEGLAGLGAADETEFRHAEYTALRSERKDTADALTCNPQEMSSYSTFVQEFFAGVTLVEKLTETRAMTGFSRIEPGANCSPGLSVARTNWLPAFRVQGEGIFIELDLDRFAEFEATADLATIKLVQRTIELDRSPLPASPGIILLHTLAHLMVKRMSFEAGYGASSIRERIYSAPAGSQYPMAGMLLFTAAGDADGTLGGLVGLGRAGALERVIVGALEDARWCGSDPICMESKGQGPDSLNLAACHACALLPETSCEFQNRTLDRRSVNRYFESIDV